MNLRPAPLRTILTLSADSLLYAIYLLAMHPLVQEELYNETHRVHGNKTPTFEKIPDQIYALCVMYETIRLFPFIGSLPQLSGEDQMLLGKYKIFKGTSISLDWINLQRNEKYWGETVDHFIPSRFDNRNNSDESGYTIMDGKIKCPAKGTFIAFSDGIRAC